MKPTGETKPNVPQKGGLSIWQSALIVFLMWLAITSILQRLLCDKLTETQLFKRIPHSFVLKFQQCK